MKLEGMDHLPREEEPGRGENTVTEDRDCLTEGRVTGGVDRVGEYVQYECVCIPKMINQN